MHIPSYQVHNVLNVYSKQLSQNKIGGESKIQRKKPLTDRIHLSPEGKRRATVEKVANDIMEKITRLGNPEDDDSSSGRVFQDSEIESAKTDRPAKNEFVFNVIDAVNRKKKTTLAIEETTFFSNRKHQIEG